MKSILAGHANAIPNKSVDRDDQNFRKLDRYFLLSLRLFCEFLRAGVAMKLVQLLGHRESNLN